MDSFVYVQDGERIEEFYEDDADTNDAYCDLCGAFLPVRWTNSDHKTECPLRRFDAGAYDLEPELVEVRAKCGSFDIVGLYPTVGGEIPYTVDVGRFVTRRYERRTECGEPATSS